MDDIYDICMLTHGNNRRKTELYQLTLDEDEQVSSNALWVFTHFDLQNNEWIHAKHDDLIDRVLVEKNMTTLCMKLAYEQMKYYPELLTELKAALDMLEQEALSPGLASAKRQVMKKIQRK